MAEIYTLITGAASGFGRSIAQRLSPSRKLLLCDINAAQLDVTVSRCANPETHLTWVRDLSELDGLGDELAALMAAKGLNIDNFIHSAGVFRVQYARTNAMALVERVFSVNLFSAMEIVRPLAQKRVNKGALRSITMLSSINSRLGAKGCYTYAASKGAVNGYCLSLAVELAPAVRVNTVSPSVIDTEMNTELFSDPEFEAAMRAIHPLGLGRTEDITDAVEFLCSERARWITGQDLVVDGGRLASR
jgi:NAD(P)-dependent dehydrogenase (short-subunit alcohol dehydrogenase family)